MTYPTSIDKTFDTSLVEVSPDYSYPFNANTSFSTTESDPSDAGLAPATLRILAEQQEQANQMQKTSAPVQYVPTQEAYDQWANVYDSDGNMLQATDDLELSTLLQEFLATVVVSRPTSSSAQINLVDLGCGTGRNTAKLLSYAWPGGCQIRITGLDFSKGMLDIAENKLVSGAGEETQLVLLQCDCFPTVSNPAASPLPLPDLLAADGLISTLVLEHIPLRDYFATLAALVSKGGYALVTNMHSEMGVISQAGFVNAQGVKVRGESFVYTPQETAEAARNAGFEVLQVKERRMEESDVDKGLVGERGKKWFGVKVWYGLVLRKID